MPGPALPAKAKHVIMLYLNGGPSQLDMFDPKPALFKYAGQRPSAVDLRTERVDGRAAAVAVRVQALRTQRRRGQRAAAATRQRHRRRCASFDRCTRSTRRTRLRARCSTPAACWPRGRRSDRGSRTAWAPRTRICRRSSRLASPAAGRRRGPGSCRSEYQGVGFHGRTIRIPEKIIPNLRNKNVDAAAQRADMDALLGAQPELHEVVRRGSVPRRPHQVDGDGLSHAVRGAGSVRHPQRAARASARSTATTPFGTGCLLARRLVEAGVRFVNVDYPGGQIWDDHRDVNDNLRKRCPDMDQAAAALIRDLKRRGLLDETLVVWGGEFGRTPVSESGSGRDHNPYGYTMFVAGGGFKGGIAYGATDEFGFKAEREPRVDPRPARHAAAPARHGSHEADLPLRRPRLPPDGRVRRSREGHPCVSLVVACARSGLLRGGVRLRLLAQEDGRRARPCASRSTRTAQAERGKQVYEANCVTCHLPDLDGSANPDAGARGAPLVGYPLRPGFRRVEGQRALQQDETRHAVGEARHV